MNKRKVERLKIIVDNLNRYIQRFEKGEIKEGMFLAGCTQNGLALLNLFRKVYRRNHNIHAFIADIKRKLIC